MPLPWHLIPSVAPHSHCAGNISDPGISAGEQLTAHTQPALRTGLMAPAWRLLHVSRRVILDLTWPTSAHLHTTCRSLDYNVASALVSSFLASLGILENERVLLICDGAVRKTRRHLKMHACCAGRYGRQRRFPLFLANSPAKKTGA